MRIDVARAIGEIPRNDWNSLVADGDLPFLEWDWLAALEESGSAAPETGWLPLHITVREGKKLLAAAPLYLKTHSLGEFGFDHRWAQAAAALKRPYYPKLVGVVPATPAAGYRFLHLPGEDREALDRLLFDAAEDICRTNRIAGLHILFADPSWAEAAARRGYHRWTHHHYLWENPGFAGFGDYIAAFSKNQRKNIRKEAGRADGQGIGIRIVEGRDAPEDYFRRMFELYTITNDKFVPWDARFVNEDFFLRLGRSFRDRRAFVEARRPDGGLIALAMLVRKGGRLWGRYWGAYEEVRDLHFGACYYAPLSWAISEGIRTFDPGAGSPHKVRRGFRAVEDYSFHKLFDPALERLFADNIDEVNRYEREIIDELNADLPLRGNPPSAGPP